MPRFSRASRLISKRDFSFVFDKPFKINNYPIQVFYRPNAKSYPRLGVIVSKQTAKLAVSRNLFRRLVRESFRQHQHLLPNVDVVVMLRSDDLKNRQLIREKIVSIWQSVASSITASSS